MLLRQSLWQVPYGTGLGPFIFQLNQKRESVCYNEAKAGLIYIGHMSIRGPRARKFSTPRDAQHLPKYNESFFNEGRFIT
jgi:hypothetical protein